VNPGFCLSIPGLRVLGWVCVVFFFWTGTTFPADEDQDLTPSRRIVKRRLSRRSGNDTFSPSPKVLSESQDAAEGSPKATREPAESPNQPVDSETTTDASGDGLKTLATGGSPLVYRKDDTEVRISGDRTVMVSKNVVEFHGHVRMERRGNVLQTDHIRYDRTTGELVATGSVVLSDPRYSLACGRLIFYGPQEMALAWESPKITEVVMDADGSIKERMEITAFQMTLYSTEQRIEGLERVRIYRQIRRAGKLELDFKITADSMDANLISRQTVFKGDVKVDNPTYTVQARRLIFDAGADRFICVGCATVVGYSAKGEPISRVEGNKIVHLIRERRSLVMGSVTASLMTEKEHGARSVDASALKDEAGMDELLSVPKPPKSKPRVPSAKRTQKKGEAR